MNCSKCHKPMLSATDGKGQYVFCPNCRCAKVTNRPELPLRDTETRPAAAKRKKPTDAQKAVQKATSEDKAVLFASAWVLSDMAKKILPWAEYKFHSERNWRFDWAFELEKVAVEVDGGQWMPGGGRHGTPEDMDKLNEATAMGWLVFRFSPKQLRDDPEKCVRQVERALRLRGESREG